VSTDVTPFAESRKYCRRLASFCLFAGIVPYFICNLNHNLMLGHAYGPDYFVWGYPVDVIWTTAFSAAAVFSVRSDLKRPWLFAVCMALLILLGLMGALLLSAPLLLVPLWIAVRSFSRRRGARVRMPRARARRNMDEKRPE
jgi:hypothetical protein